MGESLAPPPRLAKVIPGYGVKCNNPAHARVTNTSFSITHWPVAFFQVAR